VFCPLDQISRNAVVPIELIKRNLGFSLDPSFGLMADGINGDGEIVWPLVADEM
jgi:hypothetical protein